MAEPDVFESAMRIARVEYPDLDVPLYRRRLDELGREGQDHVRASGRDGVDELNAFFFGTLGFRGNQKDYYDPRNSYLNDVIDRRIGIPISLAAVYCEIGRRVGVRAHGVGFPGHFLAKCLTPGEEILVDCFNARIVTREDCQALLDSLSSGGTPVSDEMLRITPAGEIVSRMLANLRRIHTGRGEFARAIRWVDLDLELRPDAPDNFRERGMLHLRLEEFGKAVADLERYARGAPEAPDVPQVREQIHLIQKLLSQLN